MNDGEPYGFIYITTNRENGKKYIGKRHYDNKGEWKRYLGSGVVQQKAIEKYGRSQFSREIIDHAFSEQELNEKERHWINYYDAINNTEYYNIAPGGDGGNVRLGYSSEEYAASERKRLAAVRQGHLRGEQVKSARLTEFDVKEIINMIKANRSLADIGKEFGVSEMTICDIKNKKTWKHLTEHEDFLGFVGLTKAQILNLFVSLI